MRKLFVAASVLALSLLLAVPAFATGADRAGYEYGQHHAAHAREMGGFTGTMNPGVMHRGFSGWMGM